MEDAKKILVVDDNQSFAKWFEKRLTREGYSVLTAGNGQEGLALADREMPDLIVSDIDMPVMSGGAMARMLKASIRTSRIPIIFITGDLTEDEAGRQSSGESIYVSKLSGPAMLISAIRRSLAS